MSFIKFIIGLVYGVVVGSLPSLSPTLSILRSHPIMFARIEHPNQTNLVVLETRAELDCLLKFITDEFHSSGAVKYAIGLQSPDHYRGVYQWRPLGKA